MMSLLIPVAGGEASLVAFPFTVALPWIASLPVILSRLDVTPPRSAVEVL